MFDNSKLFIGGALVFMFTVYAAVRISGLLSTGDSVGPRFELMVATECGVPQVEFQIDENNRSAKATLMLHRMQRVSGKNCERVVIAVAHQVVDAVWRERLFGSRESVEVVFSERPDTPFGVSVADFKLPGRHGVIEFTLPNALIDLSYDRFQFNVSFGHFPASGLSDDSRDFFLEHHTDLLQIGVNVPLNFSLENAFPPANGGRVSRSTKGYLFEVPYVFRPSNGAATDADLSGNEYYRQTDLSSNFVSHSRSQELSYLVLFWSTIMGVGIGLLVDIVLRIGQNAPSSGKGLES